jgi:hypothetical protein
MHTLTYLYAYAYVYACLHKHTYMHAYISNVPQCKSTLRSFHCARALTHAHNPNTQRARWAQTTQKFLTNHSPQCRCVMKLARHSLLKKKIFHRTVPTQSSALLAAPRDRGQFLGPGLWTIHLWMHPPFAAPRWPRHEFSIVRACPLCVCVCVCVCVCTCMYTYIHVCV